MGPWNESSGYTGERTVGGGRDLGTVGCGEGFRSGPSVEWGSEGAVRGDRSGV